MLKKITAIFLITAFTQVYAITPVHRSLVLANELNKTFDELNYKLNVEWNQKDSKFFDESMGEAESDIQALQEQGLTNNELIQYTVDKIKDRQTQKEIYEMTKVINESQMSPEEVRAFVLTKLNSTYAEGASWGGRGSRGTFILGLLILLVVCTQLTMTIIMQKKLAEQFEQQQIPPGYSF